MSESAEQQALFRWAAMQAKARPELALLLAIPNGGHRSKATAGRLKAEGVRSGVPDVALPVARAPHGGLWIELKRQKTPGKPRGRISPAQEWWISSLQASGQLAAVCYGWLEAKELIEAYLA